MSKVSVNVKMDEDIRDKAKEVLSEVGLDMTTAVNMFLRTVIREKAIPFQISAVSIEAMRQKFVGDIMQDLTNADKDILEGNYIDFNIAMEELRKEI